MKKTPTPSMLLAAILSTSLPLAADAQGVAPSATAITAGAEAVPDETVELSPFQVSAARDTSWRAATSLVGSRTNQELAKIPLTVDVITSEFIKDLELTSTEDAARYVSGLTVSPQFESRTDDNRITYRGLNSTDTSSRNFFLWYVPTDTYNIERLDFNKGSNSLMFGNSAPGGQVTAFTKQPRDYNFAELFASYGSFGTRRVQGDFNYVLNKKLSVRLNLVDRSNKTYVENNYQALVAKHLAVAYRPWAGTQLKVEFEQGDFTRRRADNTLAVRSTAAPGRGFSTNNRWYYTSDGEVIQRTSSAPAAVDRSAAGGVVLSLLDGQAQGVLLPNGTTRSLTGFDRGFNVLGTGDYLDRSYDVFTATVNQSLGKLDLEFAYNFQRQEQNRNDVSFGSSSSPAIVEVDGAGRPYVDLDGGTNFKIFSTDARAGRFTAAYPFELGWTKQLLVVNATREQTLAGSRRFSLVNAAGTGSLANNVVRIRAYLDSPNVMDAAFWRALAPASLPASATFQPVLNEVYVNTGPVWDQRYSESANATLSGEFFNGRLLTLLGTGTYSIERKIPVDSVYTPDARGVYTLIGKPSDNPAKFRYDAAYGMDATTSMAGLTWVMLRRPDVNVNVYGVVSESFNWQSAQTFDGKVLGPITGTTYEFGLKGDLFKQRLFFTLAGYEISRSNAAFAWTPDLLSNTQLEDLINPNNLTPGSAGYLPVTTGLNNERRTVNSEERSKGLDLTLQAPRFHGLQARVTFSCTEVNVTRDFSSFQTLLEAAIARTTAATAPGGNASMAESATLIANGQNILRSNTNTTEVTGLRSAPYSGSWTLDYELPNRMGLRLGATGVWVPDYNVAILNGMAFQAGGSHLVDLYALYNCKLRKTKLTFRLGVKNVYDLTNGNSEYRKTSSLSTNAAGQPNFLYRYQEPVAVSLSTTVRF
jgi:outer membrane receptor protein involved in Fe transport